MRRGDSFFAISTRTNEIYELRKEQENRLQVRFRVSESYRSLEEAAKDAGVQSTAFGIFIDAGYLGLHRHTLQKLKERNKLMCLNTGSLCRLAGNRLLHGL